MTSRAETDAYIAATPLQRSSTPRDRSRLAAAATAVALAEQEIDRLWADSLTAGEADVSTILADAGRTLRRMGQILEDRDQAIG